MQYAAMLKLRSSFNGKADIWYSTVRDLEFIRVLLDSIGEVEVQEFFDVRENPVPRRNYKVIMVVDSLDEAMNVVLGDSPNYILTTEPKLYSIAALC